MTFGHLFIPRMRGRMKTPMLDSGGFGLDLLASGAHQKCGAEHRSIGRAIGRT